MSTRATGYIFVEMDEIWNFMSANIWTTPYARKKLLAFCRIRQRFDPKVWTISDFIQACGVRSCTLYVHLISEILEAH
jgi:hypothetical protein